MGTLPESVPIRRPFESAFLPHAAYPLTERIGDVPYRLPCIQRRDIESEAEVVHGVKDCLFFHGSQGAVDDHMHPPFGTPGQESPGN